MKTRATFSLLSLAAVVSWAHDGHGMPGEIHWHATDVLGLAVVLGLAALGFWFGRGGK